MKFIDGRGFGCKRRASSGDRDAPVVVAVPVVRVVQVARDEIVDVIAVRQRLVPATLAVLMSRGVPAAGVIRHAPIGIRRAYREPMIVDVAAVHVVQVSLMQVVGVSIMANRRMAAAASVNMATVVEML